MGRNKKIITALPVLLAISSFVWLPHLNAQVVQSKSANSMAGKSLSAIHDEAQSVIKEYFGARAPKRTSADWGKRNPFDGSDAAQGVNGGKQDNQNNQNNTSPVGYVLSGIFWNEQKPSAIINDMVVGVGSMIGSAKVQEIKEDKIILNDGNKDVVLMSGSGDQ